MGISLFVMMKFKSKHINWWFDMSCLKHSDYIPSYVFDNWQLNVSIFYEIPREYIICLFN